jgi:O-antigen/teichoic acid export membrane protein
MSRVPRNIVFNLIGQFLIVLLGFWGIRVVYRRLGDEALGILYFALAMNSLLTPLVDLGISSTVVREVARSLRGDAEYVVRLARTTAAFYWGGYAFLSAAVWVAAPWLVTRWIHLKTMVPAEAILSLRLLALAMLLMLPRSLYSNLLRGVERMEFNNAIDVSMSALRHGGTIVVVLMRGGLVGIAYFYLACFALNVVLYALAAARFFPWRAFLPRAFADVIRQNAVFASRMGAYTLLGAVQMESDKAIVSGLVPVGMLGFYGVAQTTVARANQIPGAVMSAALPRLSAIFHDDDHQGFVREYSRLQDLVCYSMVPVSAAVVFGARPLFTYLLDAHAAQVVFVPIVLLCLGFFMNGSLYMPSAVALAAGRPDIGARQNFYALLTITPITILLIWKWKLVGAGLSVVVYHLFAYGYAARRIAAECLGFAPGEWHLRVLKVVAAAAISYGAVWAVLMRGGREALASMMVAYLLASALYATIAFRAVGPEMRQGLLGWKNFMWAAVTRAVRSN